MLLLLVVCGFTVHETLWVQLSVLTVTSTGQGKWIMFWKVLEVPLRPDG